MFLILRMCIVALCPLMPVFTANVLSQESLESRMNRLEQRMDRQEAKLEAILVAVSQPRSSQFAATKPPPRLVEVPTYATQPTFAPRQAVGHTHTCANGHTWDHTMDGGSHRCPYPGCGLTQYYQDSHAQQTMQYSLPQNFGANAGGGCANGSCGTSQQFQRRGLFGFRR